MELIHLAKLSEQNERFEEMAAIMKYFIETRLESQLDFEQRNLFGFAYKSLAAQFRHAIQVLEEDFLPTANEQEHIEIKSYLTTLGHRLLLVCSEVITLLRSHLLLEFDSNAQVSLFALESSIFFHKMLGDYLRYLAELAQNPLMSALFPKSSLPHSGAPLTITASTAPTSALAHREQAQEALDAARLAYEAAFTAARRLPAANVVRLGLALNIAVFYHDLVRSPDKACLLAKREFDAAVAELSARGQLEAVLGFAGVLPSSSSTAAPTLLAADADPALKDVRLVLLQLRDNLTLWTTEADVDEASRA